MEAYHALVKHVKFEKYIIYLAAHILKFKFFSDGFY